MASKGYAWVGVVGGAPPQLPRPVEQWVNSYLDEQRFGGSEGSMRFLLPHGGTVDKHPKSKDPIIQALQDPDVSVYMANAHGSYYWAAVYWGEYVYAWDIQSAMAARGPMKLALLFHCGAMDETNAPGTFSYELRKGQDTGTVVIGITKGEQMDISKWLIWWRNWLPAFWTFVALDFPFKGAFEYAQALCRASGVEDHMVFNGDETMTRKDLV